ncbi:MAG: thioredoxin family protein, partial [Clostridiales bacterium]
RNCKALRPKYEALAEANAEVAKFCMFNAMENKALSVAQKVISVPTIVFYRNGVQIDRLSGTFTVEQIAVKVKELTA